MSRKHKHEEHANHERWLVSYADFITLLFAFFVVLFSSSQVDRSKTQKMALAIESAFSTFSMFNQPGGQASIISSTKTIGSSTRTPMTTEDGSPIFMAPEILEQSDKIITEMKGDPSLNTNSGVPTDAETALNRAKKKIIDVLDKRKARTEVQVGTDKRGLIISIREEGLFESGSAQMTVGSQYLMHEIGSMLLDLPNTVRVEGHTDNQPIRGNGSNWELSALRSVHVVKWMIDHFDLDPNRFSAVGYGEFHPIASNENEEGRKKNRRVEIVILNSTEAQRESLEKKFLNHEVKGGAEEPASLPSSETRQSPHQEVAEPQTQPHSETSSNSLESGHEVLEARLPETLEEPPHSENIVDPSEQEPVPVPPPPPSIQ